MNVNSPEFVPLARRDLPVAAGTVANRICITNHHPQLAVAARRSIIAINQQFYQPQQQQISQFTFAQILLWTPATTLWRINGGHDYDTVQRFGSNVSHHQKNHEVTDKAEDGSVNCNQFAINHGQKSVTNGTGGTSGTEGTGKSSTKGHSNRNSGGINKQRHENKSHTTHPWLVTTLKGHTDEIRDISFSSSGKFLATCAEDTIISSSGHHHQHNAGHRNSTTSDLATSDDVNSSSSNEDLATAYQIKEKMKKTTKSGRNRRRRKSQSQQQQIQSQQQQHQQEKQQQSDLQSQQQEENHQPIYTMDIDDDGKENHQQRSSKSFRKQPKSVTTLVSSPLTSNGSNSNKTPQQQQQQLKTNTTFITIDNLTKVSQVVTPPLRQYTKLNLSELELINYLRHYIIDPAQLRMYGYPVESTVYSGLTEIYKHPPRSYGTSKLLDQFLNRKEALGKRDSGSWDDNNSDVIQLSTDSGRGSDSSSSSPSVDSDSSENGEEEVGSLSSSHSTDEGILQQFLYSAVERTCVRCQNAFYVTETGEYVTRDECVYHWGKVMQGYQSGEGFRTVYTCCNSKITSGGCSSNHLHVWCGVSIGLNGPYEDYVETQPPSKSASSDDLTKVYAMDCEMCFTGLGLEVAKVTVVGIDGQIVYEQYIRPESEVVDYNTRFSGITENDLQSKNCNVKSLREVQKDLLELITSETILIGHALENDLRVLRIVHKNIIDTSIAFPHSSGFPYRRGLKSLTKTFLKRDIQVAESGHSSFEDSRACLELMLWRVRKDFRTVLEQ